MSYGLTVSGRLHAIQFLHEQGITDIWQTRELLGVPSTPGNRDPHAPANRKERPWHPPTPRDPEAP